MKHNVVVGQTLVVYSFERACFLGTVPRQLHSISQSLPSSLHQPTAFSLRLTDPPPLPYPFPTGCSPETLEKEDPEFFSAVAAFPGCDDVPLKVFVLFLSAIVGSKLTSGVSLRIRSLLPVGAGLGSSASFCVSLAAACLHLRSVLEGADTPVSELDKDIVNKWAYEGERLIHGNPSGVDNSISTHGHAIVYKRGDPLQFIDK